MKVRIGVFIATVALTAGFAVSVSAGPITNGGFELGTLAGWTTAGQVSVVSGGTDPRTNNNLILPGVDSYSAKVGDENAFGFVGVQTSSISQSFTADATTLYFAWAAVGLVPNNTPHATDETPWFQISIYNQTTSTQLVLQQFYTGNLGSIQPGWIQGATHTSGLGQNSPGIWYYRPWEQYVLGAGVAIGDQLIVTASARDCDLTGHASYVYLDGFGYTPPPVGVPEPASSLVLFGIGLVGLRAWRKLSR
jgi:hypothetical protein